MQLKDSLWRTIHFRSKSRPHGGCRDDQAVRRVHCLCRKSHFSNQHTPGRLTTICNSSFKDLDATGLWGHPHPSAHTTHRPAHIHIIKEIFESRVYINQIQTLIWPISTDQLFSLRHSNKVRLCAFLPSIQYNMDLHQRHRRLPAKGGKFFRAERSWALWSGEGPIRKTEQRYTRHK